MSTCMEWKGTIRKDGYGQLKVKGRLWLAHRWVWSQKYGEPDLYKDGKRQVLDHLCRNRKCVNLEHLELVSNRTNLLRGESPSAKHAVKTHCPQMHLFDQENTYLYNGARKCRQCRYESNRRYQQRKRQCV